ncbi:MAG: hypothetical protein ABJN22_08235 [Litorimonas sp.]
MLMQISKFYLGMSLFGVLALNANPMIAHAQTSSVETGVVEEVVDDFEADGVVYIDQDNNGFLNDEPIKHLSTFLFMIGLEEPDPPYNDSVLLKVHSESDPEVYLPIKKKLEEQGFATKLEVVSSTEPAHSP